MTIIGDHVGLRRMFHVVGVFAVLIVSGQAGEFPYETQMSQRCFNEAIAVTSFAPVAVSKVGGGMPATDSVAVLYSGAVDFGASGDESWAAGTNAVGHTQAALTVRLSDGVRHWMCYSAGEWIELTGVAAEEDEWQMKIEIDYSLGIGNERVRYSVGKTRGRGELIALSAAGSEWLPLGNGVAKDDLKVNQVLLCGDGETGAIEAKSGCRLSSGTIEVAEGFGKDYQDLVLSLTITDSWMLDSIGVELKDLEGNSLGVQTAELTDDGKAAFRFSDVVPYDSYTYGLTFHGTYRGVDVSNVKSPREVAIGVLTDWFAFSEGEFLNASKDENITVTNLQMSAPAFSPSGQVLPMSVAPKDASGIRVESVLDVSGVVLESALADLDAVDIQGALTVVRFAEDDCRAWACRRPDGTWTRLSGASAENGSYAVRMELDYREGVRSVSYWVKPSGASEWACLKDADGHVTFPLPADAVLMTKATLLGGTVSYLSAICKSLPGVATGLLLIIN